MKSKKNYYKIKTIAFTLILLICNYSFAKNKLLLPPSNNNCSGSIPLPVNSDETCTNSTTVTFTQATTSTEGDNCTSQNGADIWYEFTATSTSQTISLSNFTGTAQPIVIVLYDGNCGSLTQLSCSQNNVLNATNLTIGEVYKVKIYFNTSVPSLSNTLDVCITTPPPPSGNNQTDCLITTINYDFESPDLASSLYPEFVNHNTMQGWRTTASDQMMEIWQAPNFENIPSYSGDQFIELNANVVSGVYQDYETPQPTVFNYGFAHRGRQGTDTCQLLAGPPGGPYSPVTSVSTGNTAWSYNTGSYTVPAGQTVTRFIFQSVSSVGGASVGNFLDSISFTANNGIITPSPFYLNCGELVANLEAAGTGTWSADVNNPSPVTFSDPTANNVEISGFTAQGSYYFDWTTQYCTSSIEVIFTGDNPPDPTVTDITYCQNQTAIPLDVPLDNPNNTILYYLNGSELPNAPTPDTSNLGSTTYYVIQETNEGCQSTAVPLVVTIVEGQTPITDFTLPSEVCESENTVTPVMDTNATTGGTFTASAGVVIDADSGIIDLTSSIAGTHDITYTVAEDAENCISESSTTVSITINKAPTTFPVTTLEECDDNNDGYTIFNLTPAVSEVINNQSGYTISFHETEDGATFGGTPIADIANYSAITGTIYIRVTEEGNTTNCAGVEPLELIVHPRPELPTPSNYELCDDNNSPDGVETFDLTTREAEITYGAAGVTAEYYTSQNDAQSGNNPITTPEAYQNTTPGGETIWVAAVSDFGCRSIGSFDIIVNPLPVINPNLEPFYACEEIPGEGQFETPEMTPVVIDGASGYDVYYYTDQAAAIAGGNDNLSSPFTAPTSTIYARVVDQATLCVTITPVELEVLPAPIAPQPAPLEECDFNNDQVAIFNIDPVLQQISNALGGNVDITVHETQADATYNANPIPNTGNYSNIQAQTSNGQQTLYIRVQSSQTECFDIVTLDLIVHPTPEAQLPSDYELCDNGSDDTDGEAIFDLTIKDGEVLGTDLDPG
ncbi:hypothetical protein, partial [Flavobacterium suaedae]|uniref:hypothetical protein n=1 Tax=Flavobacterium suaedae TaxID=1767027 RepID=UPI001664FE7A